MSVYTQEELIAILELAFYRYSPLNVPDANQIDTLLKDYVAGQRAKKY